MSLQQEETGKLTAKLSVEEVKELAPYFGVPQILVNHFVVKFVGKDKEGNKVENLYFKLPYYLSKVDPKHGGRGIQSMEFEETKKGDEWEVEVKIYPQVTSRMFENLIKIQDKDERMKYWDYLTRPIPEKATASPRNVRMSTMQPYLREIAIKRAVVRALRWMVGSGETAYEELPEVELNHNEIAEAREIVKNAKPVGHGSPAPQPSASKFDLASFEWWTKDEKGKSKKWQQGDHWGFSNVEFSGEIVELAKPIVAAIANNGGAIVQDDEILSFENGQLLRRKTEGTL